MTKSNAISRQRAARARTSRRPLALLRAALYLTLVAIVSGALITRKVWAELSERTLQIGDDLGEWSSLIGPSTKVTLNGQDLFLGTLSVDMPLPQVLARFSELCMQGADEPLSSLTQAAPAAAREQALLEQLLVMQRSTPTQAAAACLAGAGRGGAAGLLQRLQAFARTRDLSTIGPLRYLRARKTERGSFVVAVWNRGPLRIDQMFPKHGDVPGEDFPAGVRPQDAQRMLSATAPGSEHGVNVYRSTRSKAQVLDEYARALESQGFALQRTAKPDSALERMGRAYVKDGQAVLVSAHAAQGGSLLSVVSLAQGMAPSRPAVP